MPCGEVPSEDGPFRVGVVAGGVPCSTTTRVLGALVGGSPAVEGDPDSGWSFEDWRCVAETAEDGTVTYRCRSAAGEIATLPD